MRLAIHADRDFVGEQNVGENLAGELAALIGVENLRSAVFRQSILQRLDAEVRFHRDRHARTIALQSP